MINFLQDLKTVGLTALFNPTFLFLLVLLFFIGRLFGWMARSLNVWKFLAIGYFGVFLFRPLHDAGLIIGGVFILGVASMYMDLFRSIFGWAGGVSDVVSAFGSRRAFEDIRRLEREIEALKSQLNASQTAFANGDGSSQQSSWRAQSKARKSKAKPSSSSGGRSDGSSSRSSRSTQFDQGSNSGKKRRTTRGDGGSKTRTASSSRTHRSKASNGPKSSQQKTQSQSSSGPKPNTGGNAGSTKSQSQRNQQTGSGPQGSQRTTGSTDQSSSQSQSRTSGSTSSNPFRDKHLATLELSPGQSYTAAELKAAWRKMAFKTHPDKGGSTAAFSACKAAYQALT